MAKKKNGYTLPHIRKSDYKCLCKTLELIEDINLSMGNEDKINKATKEDVWNCHWTLKKIIEGYDSGN